MPFNPIDSNTVALWDGDQNLSNLEWLEVVSGFTEQITFSNSPVVNVGALNGHDIIEFDGIVQNGQTSFPNLPSPFTIYMVLRWANFNSSFYLIDNGSGVTGSFVIFGSSSPDLDFNGAVNSDLPEFDWAVVTLQDDGTNSSIRINLNSPVSNTATFNRDGITLASEISGIRNTTTSFAYIIMRDVADNTATQNEFINFLMTRFAI